jgi:hypothetical protein
MNTVDRHHEALEARRDVDGRHLPPERGLGQIRGEAVFIFDLEDVATVIALHRKVGTNVVVDLRLKGIKEPRENDIWLLGAIGPRMVYSTNLDAARRACDRRMVTFAHTAPDCAEIMWNEQNWTLVSMPVTSTAPVGRGPAHGAPVQRPAAGAAADSARPLQTIRSRAAVVRRAARSHLRPHALNLFRPPAPSRRPAGPTCRRVARMYSRPPAPKSAATHNRAPRPAAPNRCAARRHRLATEGSRRTISGK